MKMNYVRQNTAFWSRSPLPSPSACVVWSVIFHEFNRRAKGNVWPNSVTMSRGDIIKASGIGHTQVERALNELLEGGYIERMLSGKHRGKKNAYKMRVLYDEKKEDLTHIGQGSGGVTLPILGKDLTHIGQGSPKATNYLLYKPLSKPRARGKALNQGFGDFDVFEKARELMRDKGKVGIDDE